MTIIVNFFLIIKDRFWRSYYKLFLDKYLICYIAIDFYLGIDSLVNIS